MADLKDILATAGNIPTAKFGSATDYEESSATGRESHGGATVWDDMRGSLIARRLEKTTGRLQYDFTENAIIMQNGGTLGDDADTLVFNMEKPHGAEPTGHLEIHLHWEQTDATAVVFEYQYRLQNNGAAKTTAWASGSVTVGTGSDKFIYSSGTLNQITDIVSIDWTGVPISSVVQIQFARTDTATGDILATFLDAHVEYSRQGSDNEYS